MGKDNRHVYLIGFMGSGKTKIGSLLARRLCRPFVDTDDTIVEETGMSINDIFEQRGEAAFREMERKVIQCLSKTDGCVVSLGGGAVVDPGNWESVSNSGITITLSYPPEILAARLKHKSDRPLLKNADGTERIERIRSLLAQREPFYRRADLVLHMNREIAPEALAAFLAEYVKESS
jgi:shikimate kinase